MSADPSTTNPTGRGHQRDHAPWPPEFVERYRDAGHWTGRTFGALLADTAREHPTRTAVVGERDGVTSRWSYAELDERAHRVAAG